ncbi:hypothetical protein Daesc_009586 [Daldinia eschscholtzii]|uniref:SKP1-like protein n=1 Tax=Daldinia eschscholtzii TaxID=292717 RepID=A0AAX6MAL5_9PEZI
MASPDPNALQLRSSDGVVVPISYKAAQQSQILAHMIEDVDAHGVTEIPISEVDGETLKIIVEWCVAKAKEVAAELARLEAERVEKARRRHERAQARAAAKEARRAERAAAYERGEEVQDSEPESEGTDSSSNAGPRPLIEAEDPHAPMIDEAPFVPPHWRDNFLKDLTKEQMFTLITAANFFDIHDLFEACAKTIADTIISMSVEEMRGYFDVQGDFTAEEEAQMTQDYGWTEP